MSGEAILRLLLFAILLVPNLAFAQSHSIADPRTGCKIALLGAPAKTMAISWAGACVKGFTHGRGALRHFHEGKPSGVYEGDMVAGWATGRGVWTSEGDRYEGAWRRGHRHGQGIETPAGGSRFEDSFRNDLPHGFGTYMAADGGVYSGNWTNGCFRQGERWATVGTTKVKCGFK
jgi:hypothetical protein